MPSHASRRLVTTTAAASILLVGAASPAFAADGLPYTAHITYISGGDNGVRTDGLASNSSGRMCIDPSLYNRTNADAGTRYNDYRYNATLYWDKVGTDPSYGTLNFTVGTDEGKKCWSGVPHNRTVYVRIKKTLFRSGQTLAGTAVVSY